MNMNYLIGIDIGTSGAKAVITDQSGELLAWAGQEYEIFTPFPGWAEEDPETWVQAAVHCVNQIVRRAAIDPRDVAGIGMTGQMHSLVCVGADNQPVRRAILWADNRSADEVHALTEKLGRASLAEWTGNPMAAGFMAASWAWLQAHEPETVRATRWLMLAKDYVRYRLTGAIGSEPSDASSTLLFDPHRMEWSAQMMQAVGVFADQLPPVYASSQVAGGLTAAAAAQCGLSAGTPVIFGGSDVSCQALAQGIIRPGTLSCTIGTGGQLFAPLLSPQEDPGLRMHLFCHCVPRIWHQEAAILTAGISLRWLRDQVFNGSDYTSLADAAAGVEAAWDGLFFLPYLQGERTPYMNAHLRAGFQGLTLRHGQANLTRALMEGVVFGLRQGLDLMLSLGTPVDQLIATGGATRHPLWIQLQADIFNRPIFVSSMEEATGRGAAILAGIGVGLYADVADAIASAVRPSQPGALPDPERVRRYARAYQEYCGWAEAVVKHTNALAD